MALLIKNVRVLGAAEKFPEPVDVFVNGDKISAIGDFPNKEAEEVIEGQGAYLSPGFIDVNTDSDHYLSLFDYPSQDDFLGQGVTTIIGGMCGSSLAPLIYGSLESIQKWADPNRINVNWHTMEDFLNVFKRNPLAVNFATLVGHSTVRRAIVGEALRDLTKNELAVFTETLKRALKEGGFGFSTGLGYVHSHETPYPEIKSLCKTTKDFDGVYATHLRDPVENLDESVKETIKLAREVGVKTLISHFMPFSGTEKIYSAALAQIASLPKTVDLNFDIYPYGASVLPLYTFLPQWAQSGGREVMLANIRDAWLQPKLEKDFRDLNPEDFVVSQAPGNDALVGCSLEELRKMYNLANYKAALLKLMLTTEFRAVIMYKNIDVKLIKRAIANPRSLIASNSASLSSSEKTKVLKPERATSTFTKFLGLVDSERIMSLEEAVNKITAAPARKFNLTGRGLVREGNFADLTVFSLPEVAPYPAGQKPERLAEIKCVAVNGVVAFKNGVFQRKFAGRALRRNAP
jgi:N-acyl-D-aspartate/D-glutamate deacylase